MRGIDPECQITQAPDIASVSSADFTGATLILIDVDQAGTDPQSLVQALSAVIGSPIVVISSAKDTDAIDQALRAGAVGYLPKTYSNQLIEAVLRLIKSGERFRPSGAEAESRKRGRPPKSAQPSDEALSALAGLTPRQKDVLLELARGASNLDISRQLNMREGTVKTHLFTIYRKLGVTNRAQAALYGMRMSELQQEQMVEAEKGKLDLSWLQPEMSHRKIRAGQWIFHQGDIGSELFYVQRGKVSFPEIGATIGAGEVFGEIGIFSPGHKRTCSARCETDVDLFTLSSGQVRRIYFGNPQFALFILTLVATRLADVRAGGAATRIV
jgi:DNA-binding NarL/FixJ family response regulator